MSLQFSVLFDRAMTDYGISAKALSGLTGVAEATISEFRRGKCDPRVSSLARLLDGIEQINPGAFKFFCQSLGEADMSANQVSRFIDQADDEQIDDLMLAIASRLKKESPQRKIRGFTGVSRSA